jgi:hypothetical protein
MLAEHGGDTGIRDEGLLESALAAGELNRFPQTLTFQSLVDATVSTPAVLSGLYERLTNPGNELVVFDINRQTDIDELLTVGPMVRLRELAGNTTRRFVFDLVTNQRPTSRRVAVHRIAGGLAAQSTQPLAWEWPKGIHSLSHVALPFPFEDPLYGASDAVTSPGIALSKITLRGERGVIKIPASAMLRIKWNPFYPYLEQRVLDFFQLAVQ